MRITKDQIKNAGIRFVHFRTTDGEGKVNPHGGMTAAYRIEVPPNSTSATVYYATAWCRSDDGTSKKHDNFSRRTGAAIAAGRLLSGGDKVMKVSIHFHHDGGWSAAMRGFVNFMIGEYATPFGLVIKARKRPAKSAAA
jgi:hypothetical protein